MRNDTRPNILLVLTDQQRFDTIQALGSHFDAQTPAMDFLANEGVAFENCFCPAPVCSPARASILSGLYPSQAGMPGNLYAPCPPMNPTLATLTHSFRAAGYETAYHGKWHLGGKIEHFGFDVAEEISHDEKTAQSAAAFWDDRDWVRTKRPLLHIVSFLNPHDHYFYDAHRSDPVYRRPWANARRGSDGMPPLAAAKRVDWDEERWGAYVRFYEERIEKADGLLGRLLDDYRCAGFFPNSWIIFSADHGDMAGEHDIPFKGPFMYDGVTRIPLIIVPPITRITGDSTRRVADPGIPPGRREQLSSSIDLAPTMLELAGIERPDYLPGNSLMPVVRDATAEAPHEVVFAEWHRPPIRMARSREWKYVRYLSGEEELYNLARDPGELHNLAGDPEAAGAKSKMAGALDRHISSTRDPFELLGEHEFIWDPPAEAL